MNLQDTQVTVFLVVLCRQLHNMKSFKVCFYNNYKHIVPLHVEFRNDYWQSEHLPRWKYKLCSLSCVDQMFLFLLPVYEWRSGLWVVPATAPGNHQETIHVWQEQQAEQTRRPAAGLDGIYSVFISTASRHKLHVSAFYDKINWRHSPPRAKAFILVQSIQERPFLSK